MTLPPERIGDKGQRYQIKYISAQDDMEDDRTLGYSTTLSGAEQMADAWRRHPEKYFVWIVDRNASVTNEADHG